MSSTLSEADTGHTSLVVSTGSFYFEFCNARPTLSTTGMGSHPMNMGCYVRVCFFLDLQVLWLEGCVGNWNR